MAVENVQIYATSDVARDIIQNSEYFTSAGKAVNEYVWNSLDYGKPNARVEVHVTHRKGKLKVRKGRTIRFKGLVIEEKKNGGGMSRDDLIRFFQMHAETLARKMGRRVRGRYGTGKSAAFGIGNTLIVDTVKDGKRNVVCLTREDLVSGSTRIPVQSLLTDQTTTKPDGTTIIIDRLKFKRLKVLSMEKFLIRSINRHLNNHDVFVGHDKLTYKTPEPEQTWSFDCPPEYRKWLGDCKLVMMLAKKELDEEERGLAILSNSYLLEVLPLESAGTAWSGRIFGEVDSPLLDSQDDIPTFDNTRSRLNRDNERVSALLAWVKECTKKVTKELEGKLKAMMDKKKFEKLEETAKELEELLNGDFADVLRELESTPQVAGVGGILGGVGLADSDKVLVGNPEGATGFSVVEDGSIPAVVSDVQGSGPVQPDPGEPLRAEISSDGIKADERSSGKEKRKPRGGFQIKCANLGKEAQRALFIPEKMVIQINLDFPELAIFGNDVEDFRFKSLLAEIAISEYAVATVSYKVENHSVDVEDTASSALYECRRTFNRLGRSLGPLLERWMSPSECKSWA
jgi:hypothetical protein